MKQNQSQAQPQPKIKLIYNPNAGKKRNILSIGKGISLEDIKNLLEQYQITVDYAPTKKAGHATQLAKESIKEGYSMVIAAGGDGTVGEVANGLINSDVTMGILPLGSFMNIARMLCIPQEMEKAIMLLKIGRSRKIDVGSIIRMKGEKLSDPYYFLESAGIGIEAHVQNHFLEFEKGSFGSLVDMIKKVANFEPKYLKLILDNDETIETEAPLVTISNGPYTGAALNVAPEAKLNDHRLTVSIYQMSKTEIITYFTALAMNKEMTTDKIQIYKTVKVKVITKKPRFLHADARVFGKTPAEFRIVPNALSVIAGFPTSGNDSALVKRTYLDP